jgi:hypothetical protein
MSNSTNLPNDGKYLFKRIFIQNENIRHTLVNELFILPTETANKGIRFYWIYAEFFAIDVMRPIFSFPPSLRAITTGD